MPKDTNPSLRSIVRHSPGFRVIEGELSLEIYTIIVLQKFLEIEPPISFRVIISGED